MKLEVLQENLKTGLAIISRVITTRPQIPILTNILLKADSGELEMVASNMETTITTKIGAKVDVPGEFTVPGKTFVELVNGLSSEKVTLTLEEGVLLVSGGKFKAKINGSPAGEFPKITELKNGSKWKLESSVFQSAVNKTLFCSSLDESRAVLTGVLFKLNNEGLTLAATDGFRLSVTKLPIKNEDKDENFIVPARALSEVVRLLSGSSFSLVNSPQSNQVLFDLGDTKIYSRLIVGNFPDFEKIIPPTSVVKLVVSVEELLKTIRLASVFARDSANIVKFKIGHGKLKISANAPQVGENESEVDVQMEKGENEEIIIAFNYRYFIDLLGNIGTGDITAEFNGPLASGMFKLPSDFNFLHIIMPVRVQG